MQRKKDKFHMVTDVLGSCLPAFLYTLVNGVALGILQNALQLLQRKSNTAGDFLLQNEGMIQLLFAGVAPLIAFWITGIFYREEVAQIPNKKSDAIQYAQAITGSVALGLLLNYGAMLLFRLLPWLWILSNPSFEKENFFLAIVVYVILTPFTEETVYRGVIFPMLRRINDNLTFAIVINSALFGLMHFNLMQGIYCFLISLFLCYFYGKTENIKIAYAIHACANFVALLLSSLA